MKAVVVDVTPLGMPYYRVGLPHTGDMTYLGAMTTTNAPAPITPQFGDTITGVDETYGVERTGSVIEIIQPLRYSGRTSPIYRIDTQDGWFRMVTWNGVAPIRPAWATSTNRH